MACKTDRNNFNEFIDSTSYIRPLHDAQQVNRRTTYKPFRTTRKYGFLCKSAT
jgi:hypothetical protein